jgi:uncharacterized protein
VSAPIAGLGRLARTLALAAAAVAAASAPSARAAVEVPYLSGRVVDDAEILDGGTRSWLSRQLADFEHRTGHQLVVLTVPTLGDETVEDFAQRVFDAWELGRKDEDDGVLVVVVPQDRKMRIQTGYGLEGDLPDAIAGRIIRNVMAPAFREGKYGLGVQKGVTAIMDRLEGKEGTVPEDPAPEAEAGGTGGLQTADLNLVERILFGAFIFGVLGLFTAIGILTPGVGWFLYFFLIPFWAVFPIVVLGGTGALFTLGAHVVGFPIAKLFLGRTEWYRKGGMRGATSGGGGGRGSWVSSSSSSSWSSSRSSSSSSFSGGGGRSGGGGASGSW